MKQIYTLSLILFSFTAFSQQKNVSTSDSQTIPSEQNNTTNPGIRNAAVSVQSRTSQAAPLPYDVNDKYMGRTAEFLGNLTVSKLPSDFPVYEKHMDLNTYDQVVNSFYLKHLTIVKENFKQKLQSK